MRAVIVTHFHPDHSGLAGWLQQESGADVYVHEKDWERLRQMLSVEEPTPETFAPDLFAKVGVDLSQTWHEMRVPAGSSREARSPHLMAAATHILRRA